MFITVKKASEILQAGGIVAFPTETVYGLGGVSTDRQAIFKIYTAKNRPMDNPLICHFYSLDHIKEYIPKMHDHTELLIDYFAPGPVSFLINMHGNCSLSHSTAGQSSVVCRIPGHPVAIDLIKQTKKPVSAPSANTSGKISPTTAQMVQSDLGNKVDGIIDGGPTSVGIESTIIDCRNKDFLTILRPGYIGKKELEQFLNSPRVLKLLKRTIPVSYGNNTHHSLTTPGSMYRHYSPDKPVYLSRSIEKLLYTLSQDITEKYAVLAFTEIIQQIQSITSLNIQNAKCYLNKAGAVILQDLYGNFFIDMGSINNLDAVASEMYSNLHLVDLLPISSGYFLGLDMLQKEKSDMSVSINNRLSKVILDEVRVRLDEPV
jgi:L-threonylcarbamoyladenylate synthase